MKHIFDASFKYTPSYDTNIARTFRLLLIDSQKAAASAASAAPALLSGQVLALKRAVSF
jgi:hypothetical protein